MRLRNDWHLCFCRFAIALFLPALASANELTILTASRPSAMEDYAARELSRYVYALSGKSPSIASDKITSDGYIIGRKGNHPLIDRLISEGKLEVAAGAQGYVLKTMSMDGKKIIVIAAGDETGVLYGVYGLLEEHYGITFSFDGDVFPAAPVDLFPALEETKTPAVAIRGFLPWTNFPQSATSWSWDDWKFILDQMAKMRMNFLQIHNYNGEEGHNEMFHNFEVGGKMSRVWMATAKTGHAWGSYPGWDVNKYPFGSSNLFDDYDFGADCALHNEKLDNMQVFRKGTNEFQRVIAYAHKRGIKIGLGLDINLIPDSYHLEPDDDKVIAARVKQIESDYPDLDYLLCFQSESLTQENAEGEKMRQRWRKIFDAFYFGLKQHVPQLRLAVAGWGLRKEDVASLPKDVICAPISKYSDSFEDGSIYKDHEYWGCPWMERDFYSSIYYYPYNMHLSNTIKAWQQRSPNMKGFYTLTWRITDAIKPKLWYVAGAPWDDKNQFSSSEAVYRGFAERQYGKKAAGLITPIINQNEPFASDFSECRWTPPFDLVPVDRRGQYLVNLRSIHFSDGNGGGMDKPAVNYAAYNQAKLASDANGQKIVGYTYNGSWLSYDDIPFDPSWTAIRMTISSATDGGKIEFRLDKPDGDVIGSGEVLPTGGWNNWKDTAISIQPKTGTHTLYIVFRSRDAATLAQTQLTKATEQLKVIEHAISYAETPGQKYRLGLLKSRIAAERDHIFLNMNAGNRSHDIAAMVRSWMGNFNSRVTDISSLGNMVSVQNRFVQKNYRELAWKQLNTYSALPPENLQAGGTKNGVKLCWQTDDSGIQGFFVYRDGEKITPALLPAGTRSYEDKVAGLHQYEVHPVKWGNDAEQPSITVPCYSGDADKEAPQIVVISPPASVLAGQPVAIKARLLDNMSDERLNATLYYRKPGATVWATMPMKRKIKAIFTAMIPAAEIGSAGIEYYIKASDNYNESVFPADAPAQPLSLVQEKSAMINTPAVPKLIAHLQTIQWQPVKGAFYFRIYRSKEKNFIPAAENLLTYLSADAALQFTDNGVDCLGEPLKGALYYKITAVDKNEYESKGSEAAVIRY